MNLVNDLQPGPELDALVAKEVMGLKVDDQGHVFQSMHEGAATLQSSKDEGKSVPCTVSIGTRVAPREYSKDMTAAMELVEKIGKVWHGFHFYMFWQEKSAYTEAGWRAGWFEESWDEIEERVGAKRESLPHAICMAALDWVRVSKLG